MALVNNDHRILIQRKWVVAIQAVYSNNYLVNFLGGKYGIKEIEISDKPMGSLIGIHVSVDDVRGRGPMFNETVNELLQARVEKIDYREVGHVEDPYALAVLCEAGVLHEGVIEYLTPVARRQVLQCDIFGGKATEGKATRLRRSRVEDV